MRNRYYYFARKKMIFNNTAVESPKQNCNAV